MTTNDISKQGNTKTPINLNTISQLYNRRKNPYDELATKALVEGWTVDAKEAAKYNKAGLNYNPNILPKLDKALAESQGAGEKLWNSLKQTLYSEITLGTIKGFADLFDVITGEVFKSDNDYSNPISRYLEEAQENFRLNNPIHVDPNINISNGGLTDVGWWASNFPSVASSLTLLIPSTGVAKGVSLLGKGIKAGKAVSYTRKALTGATKVRNIEQANRLNKFAKWANKESTIVRANRLFESGLTATAMRTLENYQESRQTYNDMYKEASNSLYNMTDEEYQDFLERNKDELATYKVDLNDREAVARAMANHAANKTFMIDYSNILFDVAQLYALGNPLKLTKNLRQTAKIRKAERLARRNRGKTAEEIAKLDASETFGKKIKNWTSDHIADGRILAANATEGIEEGVNYIAQQEGMNYGKVMLDPKMNPETAFSSRLQSYLSSPELYDAAFWGIMGGVVFQGLGSQFNRLSNAIQGKWEESKAKKKGEKTKENVATNWKEKFELPENKRRIAEINARIADEDKLYERLSQIEEGKDPFNRDTTDPSKQANITSDIEKQVARDRAIDEYIVNTTFRALETGNYDMLKSYLQDENVRNVLAEKGVIDNSSITSVDKLINRMEEVEQIYNNNLIAIDGISQSFENVPFEYIQIIARDNALAQIQQQRLDEQLGAYEESAENNARRFGANLTQGIDYKSAVELVVAARRLGTLRASKKAIEEDKEYAKSLDGQNRLKDIDNEIKLINQNLINESWSSNSEYNSFSNRFARLIWANAISTKAYYDERNQYKHDDAASEYLDYLDALSRRDFGYIQSIANVNFDITDEEIIELFGDETSSTGMYDKLSQDLNTAFDIETGLDKKAAPLNEDYQNIAALKLAKLTQQARIANTDESILTKINELHNYMNEARKKAIEESESIIFDIGKKYGSINVMGYIFSNETIPNITSEDKTKLDSALEVLNLTTDSNRILGENLKHALILGELNDEAQTQEEKELNSALENSISADNSKQTNISSQETQSLNIEQQATPQSQVTPQSPPISTQSQKVNISTNIDGTIDFDTNVGENELAYDYIEQDNGDIILNFPKEVVFPSNWLKNQALYENYNENYDSTKDTIEYPILHKDESGNITVKQKGRIIYNNTNIPSTGEQVKPDTFNSQPTPIPEPKSAPVQEPTKEREDVPPISNLDEIILQIEDNIQNEAKAIFATRDESKNVEEVIQEIENILKENHKNDDNQKHVQNAINRSIRILKARALRKGLIKAAAEVLHSDVTEMPNGKYDFSEEYKKHVVEMIEQYCRESGLRKINGKYYINLEDVLRRINKLFNEDMAKLMFGTINAYLNISESKEHFVVMDDTTNPQEFLDNVKKTEEQRLKERIGNREDKNHRVSIDHLFENPSESFLKAFDSINKGDKLSIKLEDGEVKLLKNGVIVGTLPKPLINSKTGAFYKYNNGWRTEVWKEGDKVVSNLSSIFETILTENSEVCNFINDAITELNYGNPNKKRKEELIEAIYEKLNTAFGIIDNNIVSKNNSKEEVVSYLTKLWKYINGAQYSKDERNAWISDSLETWFEKVYDSYSSINTLIDDLSNDPTNIEVIVENITSGELIRIVDDETRGVGNNYDNFTQVNEALANPNEAILGIVDPSTSNELITTDGQTIVHNQLGQSGTPHVVIPNKNGIDNYVIGTAVRFNDKNLTGDVNTIINSIKKELIYRIEKHITNNNGNYQELYDFLHDLLDSSAKGNNTGLLYGVAFTKQAKDSLGFLISVASKNRDGASLNVKNVAGKKLFSYKRTGSTEFIQGDLNKLEDQVIFKELLLEILNQTKFNISKNYIYPGYKPNGFAIKDDTGKFYISIPNSAEPNNPTNFIYDSFQDFVFKAGIIRVNTKIENNSNYRRKGLNQAANQILEVSLNRTTTSPVEGTTISDISSNSQVESILKDDNVKDKATTIIETLAEKEMPKETLTKLNSLHLLPENIIFDENFNTRNDKGYWIGNNAAYRPSTKEVVLGKRWVDMFNEEGEFSGAEPGAYRKQAIRKLIHEQLHHKLAERNKADYLSKMEAIYDEFVKSLETQDDTIKQSISKYIFSKYVENGRKDIAIEEFFVESLTSEELVNYLNSVEATFEKKKLSNNLWQRILKLLSDIFGWEVKTGSLREKQLYALQGSLSNIRKALNTKAETSTDSKVQLTLFDETDFAETNETKNKVENVSDSKVEPITEPITEASNDQSEEINDSIIDIDIDNFLNDAFNDINSDEIRGSEITESLNSYTPEMQEIKSKAIANGTFMKAPNGKPTNLNERQWLTVRTKAFINWFGNWETIAYDKARLNSIPNLRKINVDSFLKAVDSKLEKDYLTKGYLNRESVEVIKKLFDLSKTQLYQGDIKEYGLSFYTGAIVLSTMKMEEAAQVFVHEILHSYTTYAYDTDATFRKEINKYHKIALSHNSGFSKDVYEFMANTLEPDHMATLLDIPSENNSSNLLKDIINSLVKHIRAFFKIYETRGKRTLFHDVIETIYNHKKSNSESINNVSKVVDENGEPLVVYRWDNIDFTVFDKTKQGSKYKPFYGKGFYFTSSKYFANWFGSKHIANSYFLNSKELEEVDWESKYKDTYMQGDNTNYGDRHIVGIRYNMPRLKNKVLDEFVISNPNQIKSATSNTEFGTTDNIYHSSVTEAPTKHPSIYDFVQTLPTDIQAKFLNSVNSGEVSIVCK